MNHQPFPKVWRAWRDSNPRPKGPQPSALSSELQARTMPSRIGSIPRGAAIVNVRRGGFGVQGSRFRVQGSGFGVRGSGFRVRGSRFKVRRRRIPPWQIVRPVRSLITRHSSRKSGCCAGAGSEYEHEGGRNYGARGVVSQLVSSGPSDERRLLGSALSLTPTGLLGILRPEDSPLQRAFCA